MQALTAGFICYVFEASFVCVAHAFYINFWSTIAVFWKIVWNKESGPKMIGFFQNYVQDPRSQDPGF